MKIRRERLQELMDKTCETQSFIAGAAGVSRQTIGAWINEGRRAQYSNVRKVAEVLKCPVEEIAEYEHGEAVEEPGDYVRDRINAIYDNLDPATRAELLAAAERLAAVEVTRTVSLKSLRPEKDDPSLNTEVAARILREMDNPTRSTPRGKDSGLPFLDIELECPRCHLPFFVSRFKKDQKIACPKCGQHVFIAKK